jgi:hypothetical protein
MAESEGHRRGCNVVATPSGHRSNPPSAMIKYLKNKGKGGAP